MKSALLERRSVKACIASVFLSASLVVPLGVATFAPVAAHATVITNISVVGNQLIPTETIRDFAGINFGEDYSPDEINAIFRRLSDSGIFETVELRVSGNTLVVSVVENPTINIVAFEGNSKVKDEQLASIVDSVSSRPFNRLTAEADAARIATLYNQQGRIGATVEPVIIPVDDGRVNLVFQVRESRVAGVDSINFIGNTAFSDGRLRRALETDEETFLSFLLGRDTIDPAKIAADRARLTDLYTNRGYVDFQILSATPELSADRESYYLTYSVYEGFKYDFGQATVRSSITGVDAAQFERYVDIRQGRVYSADDVRDIVEEIESEATDRGYPFLRVVPNLIRDNANRVVDIEFELINARPVYVERIDISGNTGTRERVIRRQFEFVEGDPFNQRKLAEAADDLRALGIFDNVSVTVREGSSPDKAIVDVDVVDGATGSVGFALGYSSDGGFSGSISFSERNFLGRGQSFKLELSVAEKSNIFSFSFNEPYLFGRDVSAGVNLYYRDVDRGEESSYQTTNIGFEPSLGFKLAEDTNLVLRYRISSDEIRDVSATASPVISDDIGTAITSSLSATLSYNKTNSSFEPTGGYQLSLTGEYAGLGGDINFTKASARGKIYTSFFDDDLILSAEIEAGAILSSDSPTRVTDRFFLGGQTLRGFAPAGIGPRDLTTANEDALGGNYYGVVRLEGSFPIGFPDDYGIFGGVFIDAGAVWELDDTPNTAVVDDGAYIRSSAGVSLFWSTPVGPLEFSYAFPIEYQDYDVLQEFSVSIGTRF